MNGVAQMNWRAGQTSAPFFCLPIRHNAASQHIYLFRSSETGIP